MRRAPVFVAAQLLLSGCVGQQMTTGLNALRGQNIQAAVAVLGFPDGERQILGENVYIWSTSRSFVMPVATVTNTYGNVGGVPFSGQTTGMGYVPENWACTIQIMTNQAGIINNYKYEGNLGGCERYGSLLKNVAPAAVVSSEPAQSVPPLPAASPARTSNINQSELIP